MRSTRLRLLGLVIVAAAVMAGCDTSKDSDAAKPGGGNPAGAKATSAAPGLDAGSKTACTNISRDIDDNTRKVASAEKIGPPAGHSAVSAQYSAGAASIIAHTFDASGKVNEAAKQVTKAMSDLADTWATDPKKAPSKTALDAAIKQFKDACAAK